MDKQLTPEEQQAAEMAARLDALGAAVCDKRKDAINGRSMSGIEDQWIEDQEFYEGIDDANRHLHSTRWSRMKPKDQPTEPVKKDDSTSTVFMNITAPYCDAASARMADMLLSAGDSSWKISPTPIPELAMLAEGNFPIGLREQIAQANPGNPQQAKAVESGVVDEAKKRIEIAKSRSEKAQTRIQDWTVECQLNAEQRAILDDAAKLGSGVLKGPIPYKRKTVAYRENALVIEEKTVPGSKRISCWNVYPDPSCGENIHNGSYFWEVDFLTEKQVRDLQGLPGYISSQIDKVLAEGPINAVVLARNPAINDPAFIKTDRYQVWYYYGTVSREDMLAAGCQCEKDIEYVPAMLTIINSCVVKAILNPLDTGEFPYDIFAWRKKEGMPWGDGISRQGREAQRIVVAAIRAMLVNAGRAAGPILARMRGVLATDGNNKVTPWQQYEVGEEVDTDDVRKAMNVIQFPMYQAELNAIIMLGLKLMEDSTGLPMIMQGQMGKAPDTVGGMQILNDNASSVLRRLARGFDDAITEPHIRRYYNFLLQYGESEEEKGDMQIDAHGSSALVERSLQNQELGSLVQLSVNPLFNIDPKKAMREWIVSRKFDPKNFEYDDEEWKKLVASMSQGKQDPRLAIAQLRTEFEGKMKQAEMAFEQSENEKDRQNQVIVKMIDERMTDKTVSSAEKQALMRMKTLLADTSMKLNVTKDLAIADHAVDIHKHTTKPPASPVIEPRGKAKPGKSFYA